MIRDAKINDLNFILQLVVEGSRKGHFHPKIARSLLIRWGFKRNLASILSSKKRLDTNEEAYSVVYELKDRPVAFLIISTCKEYQGIELWLAAVAKDSRRKGYGSNLVDWALGYLKGHDFRAIMARCEPASEAMFQMLLRRGFQLVETSPDGCRHLLMISKRRG